MNPRRELGDVLKLTKRFRSKRWYTFEKPGFEAMHFSNSEQEVYIFMGPLPWNRLRPLPALCRDSIKHV